MEQRILSELRQARERTLALVAGLDDDELHRSPTPILSPLVWDLGHIAAFEDLWLVHRHGGRPLLRPDLMEIYDAAETPRSVRGEIEILDAPAAHDYLRAVREHTLEVLRERGVGDGRLHDMVIAHEHQHNETMLQTVSLMGGAKTLRSAPPAPSPARLKMEFVTVPAGPFEMGAPRGRFAYDNERPRHVVHVDAFAIARTPVTNADWLSFVHEGGYERRELWSDAGWNHVREQGMHATPPDDDRPVMHVSAYEADAFARAHDARLPTEAEWEKAAVWDGEHSRAWPWEGSAPDAVRANVHETGSAAPEPVGSRPDGASPCGALGMIGDVWEWTASDFAPYPGFEAYPYPEYSEVFFAQGGYRVLRGGSWATWRRLATPTFRNWDLPQRRQIFAGLRLAR